MLLSTEICYTILLLCIISEESLLRPCMGSPLCKQVLRQWWVLNMSWSIDNANGNTYHRYNNTLVALTTSSGTTIASFPGLPHFFVLWFAFSIIHGSRRAAKNFSAVLPFLCIILNTNQRTKNGGGLGIGLVRPKECDSIGFLEYLLRSCLGTDLGNTPYPAEMPPTRIPERLLARAASSLLPCTALDSDQISIICLHMWLKCYT